VRTAFLISSGDELVAGRTVDTNSGFIAEQLASLGIDVLGITVTGDDQLRLEWAFAGALEVADLVISSGGLGPTSDDLTTDAIAQVAGRRLLFDEEVAARIRGIFAALGREMPENNLRQARIPEGAVVIPNPIGTAPGFRLRLSWNGKHRHIVALPGVPREMTAMVKESVVPWLAAEMPGEHFCSRVFQTFGLTESGLSELLDDLSGRARLSYRANFPEISVRVTVRGEETEAADRLEQVSKIVRHRLGPHLIGEGEEKMEEVVGRMLAERGLKLAVAESCTGGLIGHRITNVPGSSGYLLADVVAYCDAVKTQVLGVPRTLISSRGAVSEEVAEAMAAGVRTLVGADIGVATTGIAGPHGERPGKPVGTVCVALVTSAVSRSKRYQLRGSREWIKLFTSQIALDWVRRWVLGLEPLEVVGRR